MILILDALTTPGTDRYENLINELTKFEGITHQTHHIQGVERSVTEVYLLGHTQALLVEVMQTLPGVDKVIRISAEYRVLGRHRDNERSLAFDYNGVRFSQDSFHVFAGLCAVDTRENVATMMKALQQQGMVTTRMGAYKPRTNPYTFQGQGKACLPYVFDLAGEYGIKVIAMEITHESHIDEIDQALAQSNNATGVMLQIGTRNTQNFELLKAVGRQKTYPVLFKRGFGIGLEESLNAAEYLASEGNPNVIFCLRGMKTNAGDPHRNMVDFSHVPVVKRLTRMPVCVDPSHSVGSRAVGADGILDVFHCAAQGVLTGANMVLVDFHPQPTQALVDGPQALWMSELPHFLEDMNLARETYLARVKLAQRWR